MSIKEWVCIGHSGHCHALDVGNGVLVTLNRYETGCAATYVPSVMLVKNEANAYDIVPRPVIGTREAELRDELELYKQGVINRQKQLTELSAKLHAIQSDYEHQKGITAKKNVEIANLSLEITKLNAQLAKGGLTLTKGEGGELSEVKEAGVLSFIKGFIRE